MVTDWDDAYANAAHIPGSENWPDLETPRRYRANFTPGRLTEAIAYGRHSRDRIDLFLPGGTPAGLVVFVHGGYWFKFDRGVWSQYAAGALGRGWAVAMPGYALAPEVRIAAITRSVAAAIQRAAELVAGPIVLTGHSAGGHLVTRQVCADSALPGEVLDRVRRVVSISGVHDLRPLLATKLNNELRLDRAQAAAESPALLWPLPGVRVHAWVGDAERPEFVRQTTLLANVWTGLGAEMSQTIVPGQHHFSVIDPLIDPGSELVETLVAD
jgi:acetyl esterase/lipase